MMPEILNVLALLAVFITFYAWFGCVMFVDTPEGEEFFPSLVEAWWSYVFSCRASIHYPRQSDSSSLIFLGGAGSGLW
jgi:two pore calcium channel protein